MNSIDFILGGLLMNAMPHLIFGLTKTHFLGLFGYSPKGNICYALVQFIAFILLYSYHYGIENLFHNGFLVGGLTVLVLFFILGKWIVLFYGKKDPNRNK